MDMLGFFLRGLAIGFAIAAPVGPIGVLCIQRTLALGGGAGLVTGLGAAAADGVYGAVAGFGLTAVSERLIAQRGWIAPAGGVFLCLLGLRTVFAATGESARAPGRTASLSGAFGSTFVLTLANPATILSFVAVFAGLGIADTGGRYLPATALIAGVFIGSAAWWLLLTGGVGLMRARLAGGSGARWINRVAGLVLFGFGVAALVGVWS